MPPAVGVGLEDLPASVAGGAALLVRVWFESDAGRAGFRARVTQTARVRQRGESVVVTTPQETLDAVRAWLESCLAAHDAAADDLPE